MMIEKIERAAEELLERFDIKAIPTPIEEVARVLDLHISRARALTSPGY
jgi:hypothetical protein